MVNAADYARRVRGGRIEALGIGLVAAALVVLFSTVVSVDDVQTAAAYVVAAAAVAAFVRLARRDPTGFQLTTEGGSPACSAVAQTRALPFVFVLGPPLITVGAVYTVLLPDVRVGITLVAPIGGVLFAAGFLWLTERRRVSLTPLGVVRGRVEIPWNDVVDAQPGRDRVVVRFASPGATATQAWRHRGLSVSPTRMAAAIRFYVEHPGRRGAIGTEAERIAMTTGAGGQPSA